MPTKKTQVKKLQGKAVVSRHFFKSGKPDKSKNLDVEDSKMLEVHTFESEVAHVSGKLGLTIATGNYESARVDVMVTLPTYPEEIDKCFEVVWEKAEEELSKLTKGVLPGKQFGWKPIED